MEIAV